MSRDYSGYSKVLGITVPPEPKPPVIPTTPPGQAVVLEVGGWKAKVPIVVATALLSALGVRMLPSPSPTDSSIAEIQRSNQLRELQEERFRADMRQQVESLRAQLTQTEGANINRFAIVEARLEMIKQAASARSSRPSE